MEIEEEKTPTSRLLPDYIKHAIILYRKDAERDKVKLTDTEIANRIMINFGRKLGNSTVQRIWDKYKETDSTANNWNQDGRPRLITEEQREEIEKMVLDNRMSSAR